MLSYVIPVEEKSSSVDNKTRLQLEVGLNQEENPKPKNGGPKVFSKKEKMAPTAIHNFINIEQTQGGILNGGGKKVRKVQGKISNSGPPAISTESSASSLSSKASDGTSTASQTGGATTPTGASEKLKPKLVQNGATKSTSLKRVSFGSSKGSMVETLIYETPLQEESETVTPTIEVTHHSYLTEADTSGCDSKKVRVSFFESERPHVVHSPEPGDIIFDILDATNMMTTVSVNGMQTPQYQRQASTDSGWDNPFRPDGDLSREADEIVGLIKEGKPITPTSVNGSVKIGVDERDANVQLKSQLTSAAGAAVSPKKSFNGTAKSDKTGVVEVQRTMVSPSSGGDVEPVVIKKKPKCRCCVIQ